MTRALQRRGTPWRSVLRSCSASLALHPSGRGWRWWQQVVNRGDRSDSCRGKKLRLWDKALHPSHLGGSSFSLALLVGVATLTAGAWCAACESVQALQLLLGCEYLLATIWLHWKRAERRISCKAAVKIPFNALPWWEGCWLTLLFPQVLTATGLNRHTCIHSAPFSSSLNCSSTPPCLTLWILCNSGCSHPLLLETGG